METLWNLAATALFLVSFGCLTLRWLSQCGLALPAPFSEPLPCRRGVIPDRLTLLRVFLAALGLRVAVYLSSLLLYNALSGAGLGLADLPELWTRWDAAHYRNLVELGYGGYVEDGQPLFLVFFPLYVWLVRAFRLLLPDTALAGLIVSFLCFAGGCVYLYRLASEEYGEGVARRSLILLTAFPFSFFFGGIMTESLFLLTTAAALYHIKRRQWGRFALWGALAAMTRMMGLILVGAAAAELCVSQRPLAHRGRERRQAFSRILKRVPLLLAPFLGTLSYLALNYHIAGDPFAFSKMQAHWSQGSQWFPQVLSYLLKNALSWQRTSTRWEMWIPEVVLFPLFALLLWRSWKKHSSTLTLYALVYLVLNYCLSWLLSAGRYLSCGLPFFLFAADELEGRPGTTAVLTAGMAVLQCVLLYRYFCWGQVM